MTSIAPTSVAIQAIALSLTLFRLHCRSGRHKNCLRSLAHRQLARALASPFVPPSRNAQLQLCTICPSVRHTIAPVHPNPTAAADETTSAHRHTRTEEDEFNRTSYYGLAPRNRDSAAMCVRCAHVRHITLIYPRPSSAIRSSVRPACRPATTSTTAKQIENQRRCCGAIVH